MAPPNQAMQPTGEAPAADCQGVRQEGMRPDVIDWERALPPFIGAIGGLVGVLVGSAAVLWGQRVQRKEHRRDRLRSAYADWYTALDNRNSQDDHVLQMRLHAATLFPSPEKASEAMEAAYHRQMDAQHKEIAAFSYLMLLDPSSARLKEASKIRNMEPFNTMNSELGPENPSHERFLELSRIEAEEKGKFAKRINAELGESV